MECLTFLERLDKQKPQPLYVLHGDEPFLEWQARQAIRRLILGEADDGFASSDHPGDKATWAAVMDDLLTLPMLAPRRLVSVLEADPFVSRERAKLEKWAAEWVKRTEFTGVLVLCVRTWAATTKLAKMIPDAMTLVCKSPASHALPAWCVQWCQTTYGKTLAANAARLLVEYIGPHMGQLDAELDKLAVYAGTAAKIEARDVDALVGGRQAENAWRLFDLITAGKGGEALSFLQRLFDQGEDAMKLLGAFSYRLRQVAQTGRLGIQNVPLPEALSRAGVPHPAKPSVETQLRQLGRSRIDRLYDWLLEADQGMKGGSQLTPRQLLERLVVKLARERR
jgi:DNA polymerase-3 subunit delta